MESVSELGVLYAKIKLGNNGHKLHLFGTHLSASNFDNHYYLMEALTTRKD